MKKNKKILQICGSWGNGGVERIIKNYISKWDISNISMDILSYKHAANSVFDSYLSEKNIKLYSIDNLPTNDFNEISLLQRKTMQKYARYLNFIRKYIEL